MQVEGMSRASPWSALGLSQASLFLIADHLSLRCPRTAPSAVPPPSSLSIPPLPAFLPNPPWASCRELCE